MRKTNIPFTRISAGRNFGFDSRRRTLHTFVGNYDRPTDQPTDSLIDRVTSRNNYTEAHIMSCKLQLAPFFNGRTEQLHR